MGVPYDNEYLPDKNPDDPTVENYLLLPMTPLSGKSASETFRRTRQTAISKRSNALLSVEGGRNQIKIEGVTDARYLDEFVNEVTVRGRLLHFETEQDDVLAECEPLS